MSTAVAVVAVLSQSACDRIKRAADQASVRVKQTAGEVSEKVGLEIPGHSGFAPEWRKLVDFDGTTYRFRRDLAFPPQLVVEETRRVEVSAGRVFDRSALGSASTPMEGTFDFETVFKGGAERMEVVINRARFGVTVLEGAKESADPAKVVELPEQVRALVAKDLEGRMAQLAINGGKWRLAGSVGADFRLLNWTDSLSDGMPVLQRMSGMMPRPMWLAEKRYAIGAQVGLENEGLQMVTGFPARGKMTLEFSKVGDVRGHPCGVFKVKGDLTAISVPRPDGTFEDLEWSVTEGEVWMSLLHPVLLRSDTKGVSTVRRHRPQGGPQTWWQGQTREVIERTWKAAS